MNVTILNLGVEQSTKERREGQELLFDAEWLVVARTYPVLPCNFNQISNHLLMEFFSFFSSLLAATEVVPIVTFDISRILRHPEDANQMWNPLPR